MRQLHGSEDHGRHRRETRRDIRAGAADPGLAPRARQGVFRIRLEIDGRLIRNYDATGHTARSYPSYLAGAINWFGARKISYGRHTLTFLAYDRQNNVSQVSVSIYHARPAAPRHH